MLDTHIQDQLLLGHTKALIRLECPVANAFSFLDPRTDITLTAVHYRDVRSMRRPSVIYLWIRIVCLSYPDVLIMPIYSLVTSAINQLKETGHFEWMSLSQDEAEHSIEMHLPYVRKIFAGYASRFLIVRKDQRLSSRSRQDISVVPVLVGAISKTKEKLYGSLLAPYLSQPDTFFVISSDFCHWYTIHSTLRTSLMIS